jgi:RNA polymerase primary sigma factor
MKSAAAVAQVTDNTMEKSRENTEVADLGPSDDDLEGLAGASAPATKPASRDAFGSLGDSSLSRYFRDMSAHRVLTPEEEVEAARLIESLEIELWEEILGYPPVLEVMLGALEVTLGNSLKEFAALRRLVRTYRQAKSRFDRRRQSRFDSVRRQAAEKLRVLDIDRLFVERAQMEIQRIGRGGPTKVIRGVTVHVGAPGYRAFAARVKETSGRLAEAKNRFVAANLRLVVSIARRYNRGRMPLTDLIQEGNLGLIKAVERFDHRRGYRFSTYGSWWIRHAISRALADKGRAVRIPVHMLDTVNRISKATQQIALKEGREATPQELEGETGIPVEKLEKIRSAWTEEPFSLDRPVNDEDGRRFIDFLQEEDAESPFDSIAAGSWDEELRRMLEDLTPMEARILRWRFGLDDEDELTLKEIGDKYNLSRERIRQLQEQALGKLRSRLGDKIF